MIQASTTNFNSDLGLIFTKNRAVFKHLTTFISLYKVTPCISVFLDESSLFCIESAHKIL